MGIPRDEPIFTCVFSVLNPGVFDASMQIVTPDAYKPVANMARVELIRKEHL